MVFWVGLRQGVGSASISSLVRRLSQRKRCSELSGTVGVARQLDRITSDPRVLGSAFPKSFPCLSARAWSQAVTVQLDGCTPNPPCVFPLPPVWNWYTVGCTSCYFSQTFLATHRLLETGGSSCGFFTSLRCATLRLFPHVDVNRDQLLHVLLGSCFSRTLILRAFKGSTWNGDGVDFMLSTHPSGFSTRSNVTEVLFATRLVRCALCPLKCRCVLPSLCSRPVA